MIQLLVFHICCSQWHIGISTIQWSIILLVLSCWSIVVLRWYHQLRTAHCFRQICILQPNEKFTKAVETPGGFQIISNYLIYTFARNNLDLCMGLWTFQNPDIAASTKCQKQILENSCGHSKPKSLRSKIVNGVSFSEWGEHCKRPTIKDGWNPTAPRNDPIELALTAR